MIPRGQGIKRLLISYFHIRYAYNRWRYYFISKQYLENKLEMYMKIFLSEAVALLAVGGEISNPDGNFHRDKSLAL